MSDQVEGEAGGSGAVPVAADPALRIQWDVRVSEKRQVSFITYVARDCPDEELNKVLDRCTKASNRLEWVYELEAMEDEVERLRKQLAQLHDDHGSRYDAYGKEWAERGRKGPLKLEAAQQKYLSDNINMQERRRLEITAAEAQIDILKRKIHASNSGANSKPVL